MRTFRTHGDFMSISKTFRNFKLSIFIIFLLITIISLSILNSGYDLQKIKLSNTLVKQSKALLKFDIYGNETSIELLKEQHHYMNVNYEKIKDLRKQDVIKNLYIPSTTADSAFETLGKSISSLHKVTIQYYEVQGRDYKGKIAQLQDKLHQNSRLYTDAIIKNISFKNSLILYMSLATIVVVSMIFLWYSRKLRIIYRDIKHILNVEEEDRKKVFKTDEFTAIKRRMERRPLAGGGKNLLDPLTELLNEKGLVSEFVQRNSGTAKEFVCVTIFDIDNFKELTQNYGKSFTETVIKKFAFIMNLEKKPSDILGRVGEDQFIIITPRENQDQAFTTVENIRQSIEKTLFKSPQGKISVTVSGGFTPKDKHEKIESAIATATALVKRAKVQGKNSIYKKQGFNQETNLRM